MTFDPTSVEVTGVTLPKDHCVQVPWEYINVCGYSDEFCKLPHTYTHILRTYYVHTTYYILHTTYRISDHIVSLRRDKNQQNMYPPPQYCYADKIFQMYTKVPLRLQSPKCRLPTALHWIPWKVKVCILDLNFFAHTSYSETLVGAGWPGFNRMTSSLTNKQLGRLTNWPSRNVHCTLMPPEGGLYKGR